MSKELFEQLKLHFPQAAKGAPIIKRKPNLTWKEKDALYRNLQQLEKIYKAS